MGQITVRSPGDRWGEYQCLTIDPTTNHQDHSSVTNATGLKVDNGLCPLAVCQGPFVEDREINLEEGEGVGPGWKEGWKEEGIKWGGGWGGDGKYG